MITSFLFLRAVVLLRKIVKELARGNEIATARYNLERDRLALEFPAWYKSGGKLPTPTKKVVFGTATIEEWNDKYRETHPSAQKDSQRP